jgi:hypothetical protein
MRLKAKTFYSASKRPLLPRNRVTLHLSIGERLEGRFQSGKISSSANRPSGYTLKFSTTKTSSIGCFVVARFAAGFAIHEAVGADADVDHRLAQTAIFFALAAVFWFFALCATILCGAGSDGHVAYISPSDS